MEDTNEVLKMKTDGNKIIVKFPMGRGRILIHCITFLVFLGFPLYFVFTKTMPYKLVASIVFYASFCLFYIGSFVLQLNSKMVIDVDKKQTTYFSLYKRSFCLKDIVDMRGKIADDGEGPNKKYHLVIKLKDKKIGVRVRTQSQEQTEKLMEILKAINIDESGAI